MIFNYSFLEGGQYTKVTDLVKGISAKLKEKSGTSWEKVSKHVRGLRFDDSNKRELFRKRTASEILKSGFTTGCTDRALAFIALVRTLGTPARYVETFEKKWFDNPDLDNIRGHVFVDIFDGQGSRVCDPIKGIVGVSDYKLNGRTYVPVAEGLDFGELYVLKDGVYRPRAIKLKTLSDIRGLARRLTR